MGRKLDQGLLARLRFLVPIWFNRLFDASTITCRPQVRGSFGNAPFGIHGRSCGWHIDL